MHSELLRVLFGMVALTGIGFGAGACGHSHHVGNDAEDVINDAADDTGDAVEEIADDVEDAVD